ncbi:MAG: hypothetical protein ACRD97_10010 [Nitrososphaeraceae archaeon]
MLLQWLIILKHFHLHIQTILVTNIKNTISELSTEIKNYGAEIALRKLLLSLISVQLAQNIGVDHHAATEELYYYMKKNEDISTLIVEFINKICKINRGNYS